MSVLVPIILLAGLALVVPLAIMLNQIFVVGIMMFTMLFFGQILNQFKGTTYEKQMSESQIPS
ncbi:MAG: hypothetical protein DRP42_00850 [Tenericutes bacterium]|nr:MAG: hypothetical protein DRP42_00850 [Mycoplasmatota bacterium]